MPGPLMFDFSGLVSAPGLLARPGASCVAVSNFRFPAKGIMRKREGFERLETNANSLLRNVFSLPFFGSDAVVMSGGYTLLESFTQTGAFAVAKLSNGATQNLTLGSLGLRTADVSGAASSLGAAAYVLDRYGRVGRIEANPSGTVGVNAHSVALAGMPMGLEPWTYSMNAAVYSVLAAGTLLPNNASRAYRVTWHRKTVDGSVTLGGAPTGRLVVRNIAGTSGFVGATSDVTLRIPLPTQLGDTAQLTTSYFWRLWGSRIQAAATDSPDDELYLVAEAFVTAADITNGYAVVTDVTPDVYLEASPRLHTNATNFGPSDAGLLSGQTMADEPPHAARCLEALADCMFYGGTTFRPAKALRLIAPLVAGETITIATTVPAFSLTLTAVAGAPAAAGQFTAVGTLATLGLNIEACVRNLVDAWSRGSKVPTVAAGSESAVSLYSTSQGTDAPGQIRIESVGPSFTILAGSAATGRKFSPALGTVAETVGPTSASNVLLFSKPGRADAVPPINQLVVGGASNRIDAISLYRERLLVWTTAGLFKVEGADFSSFQVTPVDTTARILGPRTACVLNDRAFAWCSDGIVEFSDAGTRRISEPIAPTLRSILEVYSGDGESFPGIASGFACIDKRNGEALFFYASKANGALDYRCTRWLAWNARTETWSTGAFAADTTTHWKAAGCNVVDNDRLVLMSPTDDIATPVRSVRLFRQMLGHVGGVVDSAYFSDDDTSASQTDVVASVTFQFQLADLDARPHWQQLRIDLEGGEQAFFPLPSGLEVLWEVDAQAAASTAVLVQPTSALVRLETPDGFRRATRQRVTIRSVAPTATTGPMGILGVKQTFADGGSRFAG